MKKISFDIDGTLLDHFNGRENPYKENIQALLKQLYENEGFDIYIITRRFGPEHKDKGIGCEHEDVYSLLDELKIVLPEEKIIFTNREYKYYTIHNLGIDIHLEDESRERELIDKFTKGSAVDVTQPDWGIKFNKLL